MCSTSRSGTCQGPILGASCWSSSIWGSARTNTPRCAPWRVWAHSSGMPAHARAVPASLLPCNAPVLGCPGGQRASGQPLCSSAAQAMGPGKENLQCSLQYCIPLFSLPSARSSPHINIHTDHQTHSNQDFARTGVSGTLFQQLWDTAPSSHLLPSGSPSSSRHDGEQFGVQQQPGHQTAVGHVMARPGSTMPD